MHLIIITITLYNFMTAERTNVVNPESIIQAAVTHEQMANPYCPIPDIFSELMEIYRFGDKSALDMALQIANESLAPRKPNIIEKFSNFIRKKIDYTNGTK